MNYLNLQLHLLLIIGLLMPEIMIAQEGRFGNYEIRVIRPRYFSKRGRVEIGGRVTVITNQTFIYSYMASGLLSYHFSEYLGVELGLTYGTDVSKEDKRILEDTFDIRTRILRPQSFATLSLMWTPIYGKFQLSSGRVVYFDTFVVGGAGQAGVFYNYDHCVDEDQDLVPDPATIPYMAGVIGVGQRFFISKNTSLNWSFRDHIINVDVADGACLPGEQSSETSIENNLTIHMGASTYF